MALAFMVAVARTALVDHAFERVGITKTSFDGFFIAALIAFVVLGAVKAGELINAQPRGWRKTLLWVIFWVVVIGGLGRFLMDAEPCRGETIRTRDGLECVE